MHWCLMTRHGGHAENYSFGEDADRVVSLHTMAATLSDGVVEPFESADASFVLYGYTRWIMDFSSSQL